MNWKVNNNDLPLDRNFLAFNKHVDGRIVEYGSIDVEIPYLIEGINIVIYRPLSQFAFDFDWTYGFYVPGKDYVYYNYNEIQYYIKSADITHWMELPEKPK